MGFREALLGLDGWCWYCCWWFEWFEWGFGRVVRGLIFSRLLVFQTMYGVSN